MSWCFVLRGISAAVSQLSQAVSSSGFAVHPDGGGIWWDKWAVWVWGLTGTSQVCLDSEQKGWKHAQIERQTFCHKNAASVVCGCFNAHTVLVLHADPFDSKHFNRQRTYGKNHTKSDDRYCLIWAGKPS